MQDLSQENHALLVKTAHALDPLGPAATRVHDAEMPDLRPPAEARQHAGPHG